MAKEYISPIVLSTSDIVKIQEDQFAKSVDVKPETVGALEFVDEVHGKDSYNSQIRNFVDRVKKIRDGDFYIEVVILRDAYFEALYYRKDDIRIFDRYTCPTPALNHHVYKYTRSCDEIELLWVLPSEEDAQMLRMNFLEAHTDCKEILQYLQDYDSGKLLAKAKTLNKETGKNAGMVLTLKDGPQIETNTRLKADIEKETKDNKKVIIE